MIITPWFRQHTSTCLRHLINDLQTVAYKYCLKDDQISLFSKCLCSRQVVSGLVYNYLILIVYHCTVSISIIGAAWCYNSIFDERSSYRCHCLTEAEFLFVLIFHADVGFTHRNYFCIFRQRSRRSITWKCSISAEITINFDWLRLGGIMNCSSKYFWKTRGHDSSSQDKTDEYSDHEVAGVMQ